MVAVCFHVGIDKAQSLLINRALSAPYPGWIYWTVLTPALGGVFVGLALHYWVPGAVGSGVPQVKLAYARSAGHVPFRDALGKFILGIVQIGSGAKCCARLRSVAPCCAASEKHLRRCSSISITTHHLTIPGGAARLNVKRGSFHDF